MLVALPPKRGPCLQVRNAVASVANFHPVIMIVPGPGPGLSVCHVSRSTMCWAWPRAPSWASASPSGPITTMPTTALSTAPTATPSARWGGARGTRRGQAAYVCVHARARVCFFKSTHGMQGLHRHCACACARSPPTRLACRRALLRPINRAKPPPPAVPTPLLHVRRTIRRATRTRPGAQFLPFIAPTPLHLQPAATREGAQDVGSPPPPPSPGELRYLRLCKALVSWQHVTLMPLLLFARYKFYIQAGVRVLCRALAAPANKGGQGVTRSCRPALDPPWTRPGPTHPRRRGTLIAPVTGPTCARMSPAACRPAQSSRAHLLPSRPLAIWPWARSTTAGRWSWRWSSPSLPGESSS